MSFYDDHYGEFIQEQVMYLEGLKRGSKLADGPSMVARVIELFTEDKDLIGKTSFVKDVLRTIAKTKRISEKQKYVLYMFLVDNDSFYGDDHSYQMESKEETVLYDEIYYDGGWSS